MVNAKEDEPRNFTAQIVRQLNMVAEEHGGQVPLHGRLFSQWLHYVFPYECPYPQLTYEAENYLVTSEYAKRFQEPMLTWQEIDAYIDEHDNDKVPPRDPDDGEDLSQWTMDEELYVGYHHQGPRVGVRGSGGWAVFGLLAKFGIV